MRLAEIHVYPLKGARGIALPRADVLVTGLRHDRRFMVVDAAGKFVTQRDEPRLALVETRIDEDRLILALPDSGDAALPLSPDTDGAPRRPIRVFDEETSCVVVEGPGGRAASELLSRHLGRPVSIVFMPDDVVRPVEAPYAKAGDRVYFADAYPLLLATYASLADLNGRLDVPVPMNRFRPNLVVDGGAAFDEERFGRARIGAEFTVRMPKRCARCSVTTVDQTTAAVGKEPLRTLASYRGESNKVYFAQNAIPDCEGRIAVGDEVAYLDPLAS